MKKIFAIGWKDLLIIYRDRAAWIMMLAAPLVLTVAMGFVTGSFADDGSSGPQQIGAVVVNQDTGQVASGLVETLQADALADLLAPTTATSAAAARQAVDDDQAAAAVIIPAGFGAALSGGAEAPGAVEIYTNPGRPISASIVESIVADYLDQVEMALISGQVAAGQLLNSGRIAPEEVATVARAAAAQLDPGAAGAITVRRETATAEAAPDFDPLAYFATGMTVFFLMYTVTIGGRSILSEREDGTLTRMLIAPTRYAQVLAGKVLGVFLSGLAQVTLLIGATSLLFNLEWGAPAGIALLIIAVVAAATGWGMLLAASSKTPGQVNAIGTAMMLIFGIVGGTFISIEAFSGFMRTLSKITPHAWALDGFGSLATGGGPADIMVPVAALLTMAVLLFGLAVIVFQRRWVSVA